MSKGRAAYPGIQSDSAALDHLHNLFIGSTAVITFELLHTNGMSQSAAMEQLADVGLCGVCMNEFSGGFSCLKNKMHLLLK